MATAAPQNHDRAALVHARVPVRATLLGTDGCAPTTWCCLKGWPCCTIPGPQPRRRLVSLPEHEMRADVPVPGGNSKGTSLATGLAPLDTPPRFDRVPLFRFYPETYNYALPREFQIHSVISVRSISNINSVLPVPFVGGSLIVLCTYSNNRHRLQMAGPAPSSSGK